MYWKDNNAVRHVQKNRTIMKKETGGTAVLREIILRLSGLLQVLVFELSIQSGCVSSVHVNNMRVYSWSDRHSLLAFWIYMVRKTNQWSIWVHVHSRTALTSVRPQVNPDSACTAVGEERTVQPDAQVYCLSQWGSRVLGHEIGLLALLVVRRATKYLSECEWSI